MTRLKERKTIHSKFRWGAVMGIDSDMVSGWFVFKAGFKVEARCPVCHSPNISYYKVRRTGLKGISSMSQGLTPACMDCGKDLPTQVKKEEKTALKTNTKSEIVKG